MRACHNHAADAAAARRAIDRHPEDASRGCSSRLVSSGCRSIARPGRWPGRHRLTSCDALLNACVFSPSPYSPSPFR